MDQTRRSYDILALVLAIGGAIVAIAVVLLYQTHANSLRDTGMTNLMAGLGGLAAVYFASAHQFLKRRLAGWSTLVLAVISVVNLALVIAQTGGLDSPFYSLWLLVIVASGLFGALYTGIFVGSTVIFYIVAMAQHGFGRDYVFGHLTDLIITLAAAGLAEWVYSRGRRSNIHRLHAQDLGGQLTEEQLKADVLMSNMADGVVVVDRSLAVQLMNPAAERLTGWDIASAQGINYRTVMHLKTSEDADVADTNDPFIECWNANQPMVKNSLVLVSKAGKKTALSLSLSPIYGADKTITGGIGLFRDISKEKEVERQRNEFISTASHEMRTPVAAIEGYISLAMNAKVATVDDRARSYLDKAHQNTQHLGDLFRDLLQITKMEDDQGAKSPVAVDVGKLVHDAVNDLQFAASKKGLTLTFTSTQAMGGREISPLFNALAEPERLREVVTNLIDNAIKFTTNGGVTVSIGGDDDTVSVAVADSGIGISSEDIPHLFQKFYRIDNSATRTIGGTGLGLYLCRSIIELYNGRLWVESEVDKGSTFRFSLPRLKNSPNLAPAPVAPPAPQPAPAAAAPLPAPTVAPAPTVPTPAVVPTPPPIPAPAPTPIATAVPPTPAPPPVPPASNPTAADSSAAKTPVAAGK